jgi:hypothetical protein
MVLTFSLFEFMNCVRAYISSGSNSNLLSTTPPLAPHSDTDSDDRAIDMIRTPAYTIVATGVASTVGGVN